MLSKLRPPKQEIQFYRGKTKDQIIEQVAETLYNSGYNPSHIVERIRTNWAIHARDNQLPPINNDSYNTLLFLCGRGFGKTRAGSEILKSAALSGAYKHMGLMAPTFGDLTKVVMDGESGINRICAPHEIPHWDKRENILYWKNGTRTMMFSSEKPERLRGNQFDFFWADEAAAYRNAEEIFRQIDFCFRLKPKTGFKPIKLITTTPKPHPFFRELVLNPNVYTVRGSSFDNAKNLSGDFITALKDTYEGTRIGRQELYGEVLEDEGGLWTESVINKSRLHHKVGMSTLSRIVIAVDPAGRSGDSADETGIIVCGVDAAGQYGYIIEDLSGRYEPLEWAKIVSELYHRYRANAVVVEVNNGWDMVEAVIRTVDSSIFVKQVIASRGKAVRAEPIAGLYEQGRILHNPGLQKLELQMITATYNSKDKSPDRVDAMVWGISDLFLSGSNFFLASS